MKFLPLLLVIVLSMPLIAAQNESTDYVCYECPYWSAEMPSTWEVQVYTDDISTEYDIDTGTDPVISLSRYLNSWALTFYGITCYPDPAISSNISIDICHFIETLEIR
jgi:hypothetical protein